MDLIVSGLMDVAGGAGPRVMLLCLFVLCATIGLFISNTATAVLMAPIAIAAAREMGVSPYPFAMIIAIAASAAFMTPVSSPVNTLVLGPGNYKFGDFVRLGVPFTLLVMAVSVIVVPWLYGFNGAARLRRRDYSELSRLISSNDRLKLGMNTSMK